jgi:hypothetical protein
MILINIRLNPCFGSTAGEPSRCRLEIRLKTSNPNFSGPVCGCAKINHLYYATLNIQLVSGTGNVGERPVMILASESVIDEIFEKGFLIAASRDSMLALGIIRNSK